MLNQEEEEAGDLPGHPQLPARVVLTGFRATGKSMVGARLADLLGYRFVDTDEELVARIRCSVAVFVREHGWPAFRELEQELLRRLAWMRKIVIAAGGGAVLHRQEWEELRRESLVVWLQADARTIRERLQADAASLTQRPSLTGIGHLEEVEALLAEREPSYRQGSDTAIDTTDRSPREIAALIKQFIVDAAKEERIPYGR